MRILVITAFALAAMGGAALLLKAAAMTNVSQREAALASLSEIVEARQAPLEFARSGVGPAILVMHGAGGGFDQGLMIGEAFLGDGFQKIAPSRFGYLGSPLPQDASTGAQADAFADLLDHLAIERLPVLAFSGGGPPALQFAERYPDRVTCIALLSTAPFTPYAPPATGRPIPTWLYEVLLGSDTVYWLLSKLMRPALENAFDARPEFRAQMSAEETQFVRRLIDSFVPASRRVKGVGNERAAIDPATRYDLERISAEALVIHAQDDQLNPFSISEALADRLPNADFVPQERGGHLLLTRHMDVRELVRAFFQRPACLGQTR